MAQLEEVQVNGRMRDIVNAGHGEYTFVESYPWTKGTKYTIAIYILLSNLDKFCNLTHGFKRYNLAVLGIQCVKSGQ